MSINICIKWHKGSVNGILQDSPSTRALIKALPHTAKAKTWGDEVYFDIPIDVQMEADAQQVVPPGTIGFWLEGGALALPFGPTPISKRDECRLASEVNLLGQLEDNPKLLSSIRAGDEITVELI